MKEKLFKIVDYSLTVVFAMGGAIAATGTIVIFIGVVGKAAIVVGKHLAENEKGFTSALIEGSKIMGAGALVMGTTIMICNGIDKYIVGDTIERNLREHQERGKQVFIVPDRCLSCRYFSGLSRLPCAVNTSLSADCKDFKILTK